MKDNVINGLFYQENFLSIEEQKLILFEIDDSAWSTNLKRRV